MTTKALKAAKDINRQKAAELVARTYSGNASDADQQRIDDWLAESPDNARKYQEALDIWQLTGGLSDYLDQLEEPQTAKKGWSDKWRNQGRFAVAASVLLAIAASLPWYFDQGEVHTALPALISYATATGEQKSVELPDGSAVTLNTNTRILVDFSDTRRRAVLDRGEAFFEVAHDSARPFVVDTGQRAVTVLGTKFDVHKSGLALQVSVVEGVVAVHPARKPVTRQDKIVDLSPATPQSLMQSTDKYRLQAGVVARFTGSPGSPHGKIEARTIKNTTRYPEWRYGAVRFINEPLSRVMKELNRYTQKKILIEDSRVMDLRVSGVFQLDVVETELHKMEKILPVSVTRYPDRIVITTR